MSRKFNFDPADEEALRKDFALSMTFGIDGVPHYAGCLRELGGVFCDDKVQAAWLGYKACANYAHGLLKRYDPDREIMIGMTTEVTRLLVVEKNKEQLNAEDPLDTMKRLMRAAVRVSGGTPV